MSSRRLFTGLFVWVLSVAAASPALAVANRVFVSARSGSNANSCDNIATPCQTFAGARSVARYSNCVFTNNGSFGVEGTGAGTFETRGNNTITGNGTAPTSGVIGSFSGN